MRPPIAALLFVALFDVACGPQVEDPTMDVEPPTQAGDPCTPEAGMPCGADLRCDVAADEAGSDAWACGEPGTSQVGEPCEVAGDCAPGAECSHPIDILECTDAESAASSGQRCETDSDCPGPLRCRPVDVMFLCAPRCTSDADCEDGLICAEARRVTNDGTLTEPFFTCSPPA